MALFDKPLDELRAYRPEPEEPADFDAFWKQTLDAAAAASAEPVAVPYDAGLTTVEVHDVTFSGWAGQPVKAWLLLPRHRTGPLPAVVQYIGYNGGRGVPWEWLTWSAAGYAHLVMDNRGQGGGGKTTADTPDVAPEGHGSSSPGFLTRGIEDPAKHFYRRLITDAVRAVDAGELPHGLAGVIADVPFLSHYRRASQITDAGPYAEIARWLKGHRYEIETAMRTLSYVDATNFAARATCPAWFSVALMDKICPPSTVFAAYHRYGGPAQIEVFPYNEHEGGGAYDTPRKLAALAEVLAPR